MRLEYNRSIDETFGFHRASTKPHKDRANAQNRRNTMKKEQRNHRKSKRNKTKPALVFRLDRIPTPVGQMLIVQDQEQRIRALDWEEYRDRMDKLFKRYYPNHDVTLTCGDGSGMILDALERYVAGELYAINDLKVETGGTAFQRSVWQMLREIPCGKTWSYGELARRIGSPTASRAVGMANGANPIGVVVPCHRVIGSDNKLTGYGGGLARKRWLLMHEGVTVMEPRQLSLV